MNRLASQWLLLLIFFTTSMGCDVATDPATRLAYELEAGTDRLGREAGATYTVQHNQPSKSGECVGPYKVQLDKVGALIIWCNDATGNTVSSHSTSYHVRFVDIPQTYIVEKPAGTALTIDLERRNDRAVITNIR